jgi:hypothetical protein
MGPTIFKNLLVPALAKNKHNAGWKPMMVKNQSFAITQKLN